MSLTESIVEDAALTMPAATLTRPLPKGEEKLRVATPSLVQTNRAFHNLLRDGSFQFQPNSLN